MPSGPDEARLPRRSPLAKTGQPSLIRAMGRWSLTAAIVNGVIGSGIFGLPSSVAALTGVWSPLAVLIAGACVFLVLLCFAEVGSRFDEAGGPYLLLGIILIGALLIRAAQIRMAARRGISVPRPY